VGRFAPKSVSAAAIVMSIGFEEGLKRVEAWGESGALDQYYRSHAARRDILRMMNRFRGAAEAFRRAPALAMGLIEQDFLNRRLAERGRANLCFRLIATKIPSALCVVFGKERKR
jgi:predicted RNA polymerase sigma factor